MLTIEKILCPTDLSDSSLRAIPFATQMAKLHGADLHLFHIYLLHSLAAIDSDKPYPGEEEARQTLEDSAAGVPWSSVVHSVGRAVHAAPAILEYAEVKDVDLIVMGSHGRRGFRRLLLGSVTEEVVRLAKCPVLVVREDADASVPTEIDRVLVPIDFSDRSSIAASYGRELASMWNAELELIHVVEPPVYSEMSFPVLTRNREAREFAEDHLARLAEKLGPGLSLSVKAVSGNAADVVIDEAARSEKTLVVIPSHGHSGIERLLLGSVTERVLRRAPCPVLVLRADGKDLRPPGSRKDSESFTENPTVEV
jgi:nucleotide-binding universal stress UspA family protein